MKKIIFERYKLVNIILFVAMLIVFTIMTTNYNKWFQNADIGYIYKIFDAIYHPIMIATKWLAGILGGLLLFPSHIFKKWLFFVLPIPLVVTYWLVQNISVNSGGVLHITRAQMAENGMIVLTMVTAVFVVGHLLYDRKKKK
jgi:hypothetical protein